MLVLARSLNESITIQLPDGRSVKVTLARAWRDGARIGIDAPRDVKVLRTELIEGEAPPPPAPRPVRSQQDAEIAACPDLGNF